MDLQRRPPGFGDYPAPAGAPEAAGGGTEGTEGTTSVPSVPGVVSASLYMSTDNSPVTSNIPDNLESTDKELEDILKDFNNSFSEGSLTGPTLNSKPNKKSKKHRD